MANGLIPEAARQGRICDIGCGLSPYFLLHTEFACKYGIDQVVSHPVPGIEIIVQDLSLTPQIPIAAGYFDVITMLAVVEHIAYASVLSILSEVYRILRPGGVFIMTTPTSLAVPVLKILAMLGMVSPVEIEDHKEVYNYGKILPVLRQAGFAHNRVQRGYFEAHMNMWLTAVK